MDFETEIPLEEIKDLLNKCLDELYSENINLFDMNYKKAVCERCLVFRFAYYLQKRLGTEHYVDCDYNSSIVNDQRISGKEVWLKKRFIDIIVHKRKRSDSDFICFEIKKWNNCTPQGIRKDQENLKILTSKFGYKYGFHIIFGKTRNKTSINVFMEGRKLSKEDNNL